MSGEKTLDLDALEKVARALAAYNERFRAVAAVKAERWDTGPWPDVEPLCEFGATFDPPTVLKLIALARQAPPAQDLSSTDGEAAHEAALAMFPDKVTHDYDPGPGLEKHPLGKIEQDNGNLRFAFVMGWKAALSAAPPPPLEWREKVARIITPRAWDDSHDIPAFSREHLKDAALAKADQILSVLSPVLGGGGVEPSPTQEHLGSARPLAQQEGGQ